MNRFQILAGHLARRAARKLVQFYFPRIEVFHRERLPGSGPILFVANHPNSLIDPVIVGIATQRPVHFLAKAPLFQTPALGPLMAAVGMLPAFRGVDDRAQVGRNLETIDLAASFLATGESVGLFPEGKSHDALKVDKVRSGAARMALQAFCKGATALQIVPLGLNYESKDRFRSGVWVCVGQPITLGTWLSGQLPEAPQTIRALTAEIDRHLKEVVIHLNEEEWQPFVDDLESLLPVGSPENDEPFAGVRQRKRLAEAINFFLEADRPRAEEMAQRIEAHRLRLEQAGCDLRSPNLCQRGWALGREFFQRALAIFPAFIPAFLGAAHHLFPFLLVRTLARKFSPPGQMTISLARLLIGLPVYFGWYLLVWFLLDGYFVSWVAWTWTLLMPFAGVFALNFFRGASREAHYWAGALALQFRPKLLNELRREHAALRDRLEMMAADYRKAVGAGTLAPVLGSPRKTGLRLWSAAAAGVFLLLIISALIFRFEHAPAIVKPGMNWAAATPGALQTRLERDERALEQIVVELESLDRRARALQSEFASGKRSFYRESDTDAIRQLLLPYLNSRTALLRIIWTYQNYDEIAFPRLQLRAFLDAYAAGAALFQASSSFVADFGKTPQARRKLNEAEPRWGIPAGVLDMVERNLSSASTRQMLARADAQYEARRANFRRLGLAGPPFDKFHETIRRARERRAGDSAAVAKSSAGDLVSGATFLPKEAATQARDFFYAWIGDTKIREPRAGRSLVGPEQLLRLRRVLKPGDILLERRNWFLSNAFLPGYWPHSALYVGTEQDLIAMGLDRDPRVAPHWAEFIKRDETGRAHVIVESVSEGVVFSSLEHSIGGADSAAALRPRLSPEKLRECIARAFSHLGKPYDFDFDFFSEDKLVCTELIYHTYDSELHFNLVPVLGRKTMPAIELVRKFAQERGKPEAELDFVAFLDGSESAGRARFASERAFIQTTSRPALTWLQ